MPVSTLVISANAPSIGSPWLLVTVPWNAPVVVSCAFTDQTRKSANTRTTRVGVRFVIFDSFCPNKTFWAGRWPRAENSRTYLRFDHAEADRADSEDSLQADICHVSLASVSRRTKQMSKIHERFMRDSPHSQS